MNCEECKGLISLFMDSELDAARADAVREHLAACSDCGAVCEDFAAILATCKTESPDELVPPNSQALWCRINNLIESEIKPEEPLPPVPPRRFWHLSFGQLAAAVLCIAIVSSVGTIFVLRSYSEPPDVDLGGRTAAPQTTIEKLLSRVGLMETPQQARDRRVKQQQAAIEYWNARVLSRRAAWDRSTREAFDRNLRVIDEAVSEYTLILQRDPEDELSGEMLDSVLNEKMNLLRDFSEL